MAPNFEENIISVHDERKPFKCEICDAYFENNANLKKHAKSVHEAKKTFKCPVCVATLTQKGSLIDILQQCMMEKSSDLRLFQKFPITVSMTK